MEYAQNSNWNIFNMEDLKIFTFLRKLLEEMLHQNQETNKKESYWKRHSSKQGSKQ